MQIKDAFIRLGVWLDQMDPELQGLVADAASRNPWFTEDNIRMAIRSIRENYLDLYKIDQWLHRYQGLRIQDIRRVALIMAGNIPLVGFHDLLCVMIAGHAAMVKLSDKDPVLLPGLIKKMSEYYPEILERVHFSDRLKDFDAIIATGSNQSATYFHKYFGNYPHIIRRNRNSIAILTGDESIEELKLLGEDIFSHFGLGCRNVSKIYIPAHYDFAKLLHILNSYKDLANHNKYRNNYEYHLATSLINNEKYMSNECIILLENQAIASRVAILHYEYYDSLPMLIESLSALSNEIQCIVGHDSIPGLESIDFGEAQKPTLADYADGVDTMLFLYGI